MQPSPGLATINYSHTQGLRYLVDTIISFNQEHANTTTCQDNLEDVWNNELLRFLPEAPFFYNPRPLTNFCDDYKFIMLHTNYFNRTFNRWFFEEPFNRFCNTEEDFGSRYKSEC